jgi:hypothetical protein
MSWNVSWIKYVAKALVAVLTVILTGVVAGELNIDPWLVYTIQSVIAGLGVYITANGPKPVGS